MSATQVFYVIEIKLCKSTLSVLHLKFLTMCEFAGFLFLEDLFPWGQAFSGPIYRGPIYPTSNIINCSCTSAKNV